MSVKWIDSFHSAEWISRTLFMAVLDTNKAFATGWTDIREGKQQNADTAFPYVNRSTDSLEKQHSSAISFNQLHANFSWKSFLTWICSERHFLSNVNFIELRIISAFKAGLLSRLTRQVKISQPIDTDWRNVLLVADRISAKNCMFICDKTTSVTIQCPICAVILGIHYVISVLSMSSCRTCAFAVMRHHQLFNAFKIYYLS